MPHHNDLTLHDLLQIIRRRRNTIYVTIGVFLGVAAVGCILSTRLYDASGTIYLQKSSSDSLGLDSIMNGGMSDASDSMTVNVDLQTQANILQSDSLALSVIKDLHLDTTKDFRPGFNPLGYALSLITPRGPSDPRNASIEESPRKRQLVLGVFSKHLKVKPVIGTRLIEVSYSHTDPKIAAEVVNDLVRQLIEYTFQVRFKATSDASKWLEEQLDELRNQTTDLQAKVVAMQKDTGLYGMGGTDPQGKPVIYSPALDTLQQSTLALSQSQSNRIVKGAIYEAVKTGNAELISQLSGTAMAGSASSGVANSFGLIQTLRSQEASQQSQMAQDAAKFGPEYPKLLEERAALARTDHSIQEELDRIKSRAQNDYEIAKQEEVSAQGAYQQARREADRLNDKTVQFAIAQREASQSEDLYQDLLRRLNEAGIIDGLHSSNLTIVDVARPPAKPSKPNVPLYLAFGTGTGIFFGLSAALTLNAVDNRIRGAEEIEDLSLPLLGILPKFPPYDLKHGQPMIASPQSAYSEALRHLRSTLLLSRSGYPPQVLMVSSGGPSEGKSTTALNLAIALAQHNKKVLLLETDMRRPTLSRRLSLPDSIGLSQLLSQQESAFTETTLPELTNLTLVTAGPIPPYPAELLGSAHFCSLLKKWKQEFDFVVIDTPPVLPVTDAKLIASYADVTLLVVRVGVTTRSTLLRSYKLLVSEEKSRLSAPVGVVLNALPVSSSAYYEYYGYKQNGYYRETNANHHQV